MKNCGLGIKERVLELKSDLYSKDRIFLCRRISSRFTTISSHFFDNYLYIFHKTENQMVILRCYKSTNLWFRLFSSSVKD